MIKLEDVYKSYSAIKVLEGVNIQAERGRSLCVFGKSGCGKSTVLKLMALITRPDKGRLAIDGKDIASMSDVVLDETRREKIAYSFQEPLLLPYVTALENVREATGAPKEKAIDVLTRLGLSDRLNHRPMRLSGGEKKRVDVARAILKGSAILIADEPLSNLDPDIGSVVMEFLKEHKEKGGVAVYSSVEPSGTKFADDVFSMTGTEQ